jgi:hypothetical protein
MNFLVIAITIIIGVLTMAPQTVTSRMTRNFAYLATYINEGSRGCWIYALEENNKGFICIYH